METATGNWFRAKSFVSSELVGPLSLRRLAFLFFLGVLVVVLHENFRISLKLPGHHGLEEMALLVLGRLVCTHRWSATFVALVAASTAAAIGTGHGALTPVFFILPGLALDLLVLAAPFWRVQLFVLPVFAALAYATKPALRWMAMQTTGLEFGSLKAGALYPLSTHLIFGFSGALVAVLLWVGWQHSSRR